MGAPNPYQATNVPDTNKPQQSRFAGCLLVAVFAIVVLVVFIFFIRLRSQRLVEIEVQRARQAEIEIREKARQAIENSQSE